MSIKENAGKVGYGSWYCNLHANQEEREQAQKQCYERVSSEVKEGDQVKIQYVGGNEPRYYSGTVEYVAYDKMGGGWVCLQQKKTKKLLDLVFIDDIQVLKKAEVQSL